jgi:rare lipoprotein A
MKYFKKTIIILLCILVTACENSAMQYADFGVNPDDYQGYYKIGEPYIVKNKKYCPKEDEQYKAEGIASWYGSFFHGKKTANGDKFNKRALTAAHPTLPLPSVVRVTNIENNKTVILMVNDRGPFSKKRLIDVSERAAEILGMKRKGMAKVIVEYLPEHTQKLKEGLGIEEIHKGIVFNKSIDGNSKIKLTQNKADKSLYIRIGSLKNKNMAKKLAFDYSHFGGIKIEKNINNVNYDIKIGPISDRKHAQLVLQKIIDNDNTKIALLK